MLYVSSEAIYFYSRFNDSIKLFFGKKTKLKINLSDILMIEKGTTVGMFDNAIKITLKDNLKIFLTSFISRDDCF